MKKAKKINRNDSSSKKITFEISANSNSAVYLAGTFNNWNPKEHQMKDTRGNGKYSIALMLPKGGHEYKFVINDNWVVDPACQDRTHNSFGSLNSVKRID